MKKCIVFLDDVISSLEELQNSRERGEIMAYDYAKLNGRIIEKCGTQAIFAKRMGLSERTVSLKLNNKVAWKQTEMQKAAWVLEIPKTEIQTYFFNNVGSK